MTVKAVKNAPVAHLGQHQNRQSTGFDLYSNFHLKFSNSRRVNKIKFVLGNN